MKFLIFGFLVALGIGQSKGYEENEVMSADTKTDNTNIENNNIDYVKQDETILENMFPADNDSFNVELEEIPEFITDIIVNEGLRNKFNGVKNDFNKHQSEHLMHDDTINNDQLVTYLEQQNSQSSSKGKEVISNPTDNNKQKNGILNNENKFSYIQDKLFSIQPQFIFQFMPPKLQIISSGLNNDRIWDELNSQRFKPDNIIDDEEIYAEKSKSLSSYNHKLQPNFPILDNKFHIMLPERSTTENRLKESLLPNGVYIRFQLYDTSIKENMFMNDYDETLYTKRQDIPNMMTNNDYSYQDDYFVKPEFQDMVHDSQKQTFDSSLGIVEDFPKIEQSLLPPTEYHHIPKVKPYHELTKHNKFASPKIQTFYRPVGRLVIYDIHKPYLTHLQNKYKMENTDLLLPTSHNGKTSISQSGQTEYLSKATNTHFSQLKKHSKIEKRNAVYSKFDVTDSIITKKNGKPEENYKSISRRYDGPGLPFKHEGPSFRQTGPYRLPGSLNVQGIHGRGAFPYRFNQQSHEQGGFPYRFPQQQQPHYGDLSNRELRHIMYRIFGI